MSTVKKLEVSIVCQLFVKNRLILIHLTLSALKDDFKKTHFLFLKYFIIW